MRNLHDAAAVWTRKAVLRVAIAVLSAICGYPSFAVEARPLVPAEHRFDYYSGRLPSCDDPSVLERIQSRFYARESEFWKSGLQILGFDRVRQVGLRTNGLDYIPRRYCTARAVLNNRSTPAVTYSIVEDMGIISWGFGVDWCVAGLDRNYAYAPNCKMALP